MPNMDEKIASILAKAAMSIKEAELVYGVGSTCLREAVRQGQLESFRIGRKIRLPTAPARRRIQLDSEATAA